MFHDPFFNETCAERRRRLGYMSAEARRGLVLFIGVYLFTVVVVPLSLGAFAVRTGVLFSSIL